MNREEELFQKRLLDLANTADRKNIVTFTEFCDLNQLNIFHSSERELAFVRTQLFGGYENAERQIIAFIPDALSYEWRYPVSCIKITPLNEKYAETLTHRDYLGAVLNLGIDRGRTGDILVDGKTAYLFCLENMAEFILNELTRVRHTQVNTFLAKEDEFDFEPKYELVRGTVASVRLDSLMSLAFRSSRSSLTGLIEGGKVFVNGKMITSNGCRPKEGDIISVRGMGRFCYCGTSSVSKKGRLYAEIKKYI